jgi:hypothetical protein
VRDYFTFYNQERFHQALDYQTPAQVYTGEQKMIGQVRAIYEQEEQQGGKG